MNNYQTANIRTMTTYAIRQATPADLESVVQIWSACELVKPQNDPRKDFELALNNPTSTVFVLENAKQMIGAVMVGFDGHRGWFYYLGVHPDFQSIGNGRKLVDACEAWLGEQGAPKAMLMVRHSNTKVLEFYKKLGYVVEETHVLGKRFER